MKKFIAIALSLILALGLFAGCESTQDKIDAVSGYWVATLPESEDLTLQILENMDMYEEEIALIDTGALCFVQTLTLNADGTYSYSLDVDGTKACVKEFFEKAFDALYEDRTQLNQVYETEFDEVTREEFDAFYAGLYELDTLDDVIANFADIAYNYEDFGVYEDGTFTIRGKFIVMTCEESGTGNLGYTLDGDSLELVYSDGTENYIRGN